MFDEQYVPEKRRYLRSVLRHPIMFTRALWANRHQTVEHKVLKIARFLWTYDNHLKAKREEDFG